jgi:hypothetical protein
MTGIGEESIVADFKVLSHKFALKARVNGWKQNRLPSTFQANYNYNKKLNCSTR